MEVFVKTLYTVENRDFWTQFDPCVKDTLKVRESKCLRGPHELEGGPEMPDGAGRTTGAF